MVARGNIASVSWGDHLTFGEGDGRLATVEAVRCRMTRWREELGATALHWRVPRTEIEGVFHAAPDREHPTLRGIADVDWDALQVVPELACEAGLEPWLYVSLFDEGWLLEPESERAVSYHNTMHGQHVSWQSQFSAEHPEYAVVSRDGGARQWGVLCLACPEVHAHFIARFISLLGRGAWRGLFVCLRSQSRTAEHADQFGFNEPVIRQFADKYGVDIRNTEFDVQAWRDLLGSHLMQIVAELRSALQMPGDPPEPRCWLGIGAPTDDVLGPPLGNTTLEWKRWAGSGLIDALVIGQDSTHCPSMWHRLWPMYDGGGYSEDYRLATDADLPNWLADRYAPAIAASDARLFVARQWKPRGSERERTLVSSGGVSGLVHSTFRLDNPDAVRRGDWRA